MTNATTRGASGTAALWRCTPSSGRLRALAADRERRHPGVGERRLSGCEARERHAVGRAADVVEPEAVAERDRARLAPCSPQMPIFSPGLRAAAALDGDPHQVADAFLVEHLEGIALQDPCSR